MVGKAEERGGETQTQRIKVNVGGKVFETNLETLISAGEGTVLASAAQGAMAAGKEEIFFDRDPKLFTIIIQLLRTGKLPCALKSSQFRDALIDEAQYYGVPHLLRAALAPAPLNGANMRKSKVIAQVGGGHVFSVAMAASCDGSIWVGYFNTITVFDWALRKCNTTLIEYEISSLHRISEKRAVVGCQESEGFMHVYDVIGGVQVKSLRWESCQETANVDQIVSSDKEIFASCSSEEKLIDAVLVVDKTTFKISRELNMQKGLFSCEGDYYDAAPNMLQWLPSNNLLLFSGNRIIRPFKDGSTPSHSSYIHYIQLWDVRSDKAIWKWVEQTKPYIDQRYSCIGVTASEELNCIFRTSSVGSYRILFTDLRRLQSDGPWIPLYRRVTFLPSSGVEPLNEGSPELLAHRNQLFCSRDGEVEVWSALPSSARSLQDTSAEEKRYSEQCSEYSFTYNLPEQSGSTPSGSRVTDMQVGGNRLFLAREDVGDVEVWESRN